MAKQENVFDCYDENLKLVLFNERNIDFSEIINTEPKKIACWIVKNRKKITYNMKTKKNEQKNKNLDKYTQLRKFYDELLKIQLKIESDKNIDFKIFLTSIYMLVSKSAYAFARGKLSEKFSSFIEKNVKNITTKDDIDMFVLYYEAILGYVKYFDSFENDNKEEQ